MYNMRIIMISVLYRNAELFCTRTEKGRNYIQRSNRRVVKRDKLFYMLLILISAAHGTTHSLLSLLIRNISQTGKCVSCNV